MKRISRRAAGTFLGVALVITMTAGAAWAVPLLWGVDEDDGQLFSIGDYTNPAATFTDYGLLKYNSGGSLRNVGRHIEAFTIDAAGIAYMALNKDLGGFIEPVFMTFNINSAQPASTGIPNVVTLVGTMGIPAGHPFTHSGDNITGLAIHPITKQLYALYRNNGNSTDDRLLIIDKSTGALIQDIGSMTGLGRAVRSGEDLVFDPAGNLYVTDNLSPDYLYLVSAGTAEILAILDNNPAGGIGGGPIKIEALAWDPENNRLIAAEDDGNRLFQLTLGLAASAPTPNHGNNILYGTVPGLTDIEGWAFLPQSPPVPEPGTLLLIGSGLVGIGVGARRRHRRK